MEVRFIIRTRTGQVIEGAWESPAGGTIEDGQRGLQRLLGRRDEVWGIVRDGEDPIFVRVAAIESVEMRTR